MKTAVEWLIDMLITENECKQSAEEYYKETFIT
jgi:hypothetical protein